MTNAFAASGLFGDHFHDPAIAAEFSADAFTRRMLRFEAAWSGALGACGVVSAANAAKAQDVIAGFQGADFKTGANRDGLPVPSLVAALKKGQTPTVAAAIPTGATSQDVIDTAMMMTCLAVVDVLDVRIERVLARLYHLNDQFGANPLMARTRMQAALPATVALRVDAWRRPLAEYRARADALCKDLGVVQVGGPIGLRDIPQSDLQDVAAQAAQTLGLSATPVWHVDRSRIVGFGHWLTLVAGTLGKIGQDVALMAQQGVSEVTLSGGGGSSAMPHKQNPVGAETMVTLARYVAGQQGILAQAMLHEQERSGSAWALEWLTLPAMAEAVGASLEQADNVLGAVTRMGAPDLL